MFIELRLALRCETGIRAGHVHRTAGIEEGGSVAVGLRGAWLEPSCETRVQFASYTGAKCTRVCARDRTHILQCPPFPSTTSLTAMGRASATITVPGRAADAEALWYDAQRWPAWVDGFGHVVKLDDHWPEPDARLVWDSKPGGRGRVVERVTSHVQRQ